VHFCREQHADKDDHDTRTVLDNEEIPKENQGAKEGKGKKEKKLKSKDAENKMKSSESSVVSQEPQASLSQNKHSVPDQKRAPHQKLLITPGGQWFDMVGYSTSFGFLQFRV